MPEKDPPGAECQEEGDDPPNHFALVFCGLIIASGSLGEVTSAAYGWLAFGLGLFLVGMIEWWKE